MNEQDKTLYDFAEQVRRLMIDIMGSSVGGNAEQCGVYAAEVCTMAARMKTYAEMRESMNDPNRYDLSTLPEKAAFDE